VPTADGRFKGISLGGKAAEAWERIFGQPKRPCVDCGDEVRADCPEPALCPACASCGYA
jgi:hypothetical protein